MKNKTLIVSIAAVAVLAIAAAVGINLARKNNKEDSNMDTANTATTTSSQAKVGSKTLVVYYSASNNTERVAEQIAENLNADIFEIEPKEAYTSDDLDWTNDSSRVNREHEDESLRKVELTNTVVPNWSEYDTVLLGYPIWWGIAAWPTNSFVKANDFTGKTVYTFCTSSSSSLGNSTELLRADANGGTWQDGMRFSSSADDDTIKAWTDSLK